MSSGSRWFRWSVFPGGPLGGSSADTTPSAAQSSFTATPATITADGVDDAALASTWQNAAGDPLAGKSVTYSMLDGTPSAAQSSLSLSQSAVETGIEITVTITLRNAAGVPIPGLPGAHIPLQATGTGNTLGTVSATNGSGVATATFEASVAEVKTFSLTCGGVVIDPVDLTVTGDLTILFESDWATATGASDNAVTDGGTWPLNQSGDPSTIQSVVAASGETLVNGGVTLASRGWPTTNAYKAFMGISGHRVAIASTDTTLPALGIGETRHYEQVICVDIDDAEGNLSSSSEHGTANDSTNGDAPTWQWGIGSNDDGTFEMGIGDPSDSYPHIVFNVSGVTLTKGLVYKRYWAFTRTDTDTFTIPYVRIRDKDNVLVADADDMVEQDGTLPGGSLANHSAGHPYASSTVFRSFQTGSNGPSGWPSTGDVYVYHTRHRVSDDGPLDGGP